MAGGVGALLVFTVSYLATGGRAKDRFDVGIKAATATAALAAGVLTWGRLELSRYEHRLGVDRDLTERYSRSIEQIGSDDKFVRIGGIYAIERFALDAARTDQHSDIDWQMALDVLATLAREVSHEAATRTSIDGSPEPATDAEAPRAVVEAIRVLSRFSERSGRRAFDKSGAPVMAGGRELSGVMLRAERLANVNLAGADLTQANLTDADLTDAELTQTQLVRADLARANLTNAKLANATLTEADLTGAKLINATLTDADLSFSNLTLADLTDTNLTDAKLSYANVTDAKFPHANLTGATLFHANLTGANLGLDLWEADMTSPSVNLRVNLTDANLVHANLTDAKLNSANLTGASIINANLTGADLSYADLTNAILGYKSTYSPPGVNYGANLSDAKLDHANLTGANLTNAKLANATLREADLTGAHLTDADLTGADLTYADLTGTDLTRVRYDDTTAWPGGFEPSASA